MKKVLGMVWGSRGMEMYINDKNGNVIDLTGDSPVPMRVSEENGKLAWGYNANENDVTAIKLRTWFFNDNRKLFYGGKSFTAADIFQELIKTCLDVARNKVASMSSRKDIIIKDVAFSSPLTSFDEKMLIVRSFEKIGVKAELRESHQLEMMGFVNGSPNINKNVLTIHIADDDIAVGVKKTKERPLYEERNRSGKTEFNNSLIDLIKDKFESAGVDWKQLEQRKGDLELLQEMDKEVETFYQSRDAYNDICIDGKSIRFYENETKEAIRLDIERILMLIDKANKDNIKFDAVSFSDFASTPIIARELKEELKKQNLVSNDVEFKYSKSENISKALMQEAGDVERKLNSSVIL